MFDQGKPTPALLSQDNVTFFLGPRPGRKSFNTLADMRLTHCCTLLSEREQVQPVEKICTRLGCGWVWLPMDGGRLEALRNVDLAGHVRALSRAVDGTTEPRLYLHCSAGIHRTGFFAYVLLRLRGLERAEALSKLSELRPVTAEQVGEERIDLADELVSDLACR